jgi:4-methylaminobutanoate oxidase (formaldehyde-forming)
VPEHTRAIIIGGGIAGCSIAYHLARRGWTDVVLLDKGELTSGSTWHAAGMVTHFHTSPTLMRMRQQSIRLYRSLQSGPEATRHWHEVGSVRIASSRDQLKFLQRQVGMAKAIGLDVAIISPAEALRIFPLMSDESLYGAIYLPGDGWLDPSGATMELARHARQLVVYTQFLNPRGGIESDLTVTRLAGDRFRVTTGSNFIASDLGWIRMHLPEHGSVEVRDVTGDWACIGLWGPRAREVLRAVTDADLSDEAFPYMSARSIQVDGTEVWAQRVTYVGELGWEVYVGVGQAGPVWDALMGAGRSHGIRPAGYKAVDSLRLEKGYRCWSTDITPVENPYEAGLGFCVRLAKGDFIGREALLRIKEQGARQKLCTATLLPGIPAEAVLYGGEAVYAGGAVAGRLRSAGYGYTVGMHIGLVYLPRHLAAEGTPLEIEAFGERYPGAVAADVLYDPRGSRLRG